MLSQDYSTCLWICSICKSVESRWHWSFWIFINKTNVFLCIEILNENDSIRVVNVLGPEWDTAHEHHAHDDMHSLSGHKLSSFEPIVIWLKKSDDIHNFWFISNSCAKRQKHNDSYLTFDLNYSSYIKT